MKIARNPPLSEHPNEWKPPFVGAMKIARPFRFSEYPVEWCKPPQPSPAPSLRELSSECETEGVSPDEWWNLPTSEFRRGDENRPNPSGFASTRLNGTHPFPAPSLRELSSECETEGVSSVGCFGPTVYSQSHKKL